MKESKALQYCQYYNGKKIPEDGSVTGYKHPEAMEAIVSNMNERERERFLFHAEYFAHAEQFYVRQYECVTNNTNWFQEERRSILYNISDIASRFSEYGIDVDLSGIRLGIVSCLEDVFIHLVNKADYPVEVSLKNRFQDFINEYKSILKYL